MSNNDRCRHCGGNLRLYENEHGEKAVKCLQCSRPHVEVIGNAEENASEGIMVKKAGYYDENMARIIHDFGQMPIVDLEKKWLMPRKAFYQLKKRWEKLGFKFPIAFCDSDKSEIEDTTPTKEQYYDEHRDEILADRLTIGRGRTLVKWRISLAMWAELKPRWIKEGIKIPDLRLKTTVKEVKKHTEEVLIKELEKGNTPHTPTVIEEHQKEHLKAAERVRAKTGNVLSSEDKIEITVGRLEEILREIEYLEGYRQAVLDIFGNGNKISVGEKAEEE